MKRLTALLLCVCLMLSLGAPALADVGATSYRQDEKLTSQLKTSGFEGALTFSVSGDAPSFLPASVWQALKNALPALTLDLTRTVTLKSGAENGSETILALKNGAAELTRFNYLTDGNGVRYAQSPLLADSGLTYAFEGGFDLAGLFSDAVSNTQWPSLLHVLFAINGADAAWQTRAQNAASGYQTRITAWLQTYVTTQTERDVTGGFITTMTYQIPAAAVLQELKQLLVDFYSDTALLSILREVLNAREQAAYLQPAMLLPFLQMLDNVTLEGELYIKRQFDVSGALLYESLQLPFPETFPLASLTFVRVPVTGGQSVQLSGAVRETAQGALKALAGISFDLSAQSAEQGVWTGAATLVLPAAQDEFTVSESAQKTISLTYNLDLPDPVDTADTLNNRYERRYEATLLVKPDSALGLSPLSLSLAASIYSKSSSKRSVTYLDGSLALTDLGSSGSLALNFSGKTAMAWAPTLIESAQTSALRVDLMDDAARVTLSRQLLTHLTDALNKLLTQAIPGLPLSSPAPSSTPKPGDGSLG